MRCGAEQARRRSSSWLVGAGHGSHLEPEGHSHSQSRRIPPTHLAKLFDGLCQHIALLHLLNLRPHLVAIQHTAGQWAGPGRARKVGRQRRATNAGRATSQPAPQAHCTAAGTAAAAPQPRNHAAPEPRPQQGAGELELLPEPQRVPHTRQRDRQLAVTQYHLGRAGGLGVSDRRGRAVHSRALAPARAALRQAQHAQPASLHRRTCAPMACASRSATRNSSPGITSRFLPTLASSLAGGGAQGAGLEVSTPGGARNIPSHPTSHPSSAHSRATTHHHHHHHPLLSATTKRYPPRVDALEGRGAARADLSHHLRQAWLTNLVGCQDGLPLPAQLHKHHLQGVLRRRAWWPGDQARRTGPAASQPTTQSPAATAAA